MLAFLLNYEHYLKSRLPINPERRDQWLAAIAAAGLPANNISHICKRHFGPSAFTNTLLPNLKETAVPSNFPIAIHKHRTTAPTKRTLKQIDEIKLELPEAYVLNLIFLRKKFFDFLKLCNFLLRPIETVPSICTKCNEPNIQDLIQKIQQAEEKCKQKEFEENEIKLEMELLNECLRVRNKTKECDICKKNIPAYDYYRHICRKNMPIVRCGYCPWAFVSVSSLQRHVRAFHATENYTLGCDFCADEYETALLLEMHIEKCHQESYSIIDEKPTFVIESVEEMVEWQGQDD